MRPAFEHSLACANGQRPLRAGDVVHWPGDPRDVGDVHECGERDFLVVWRLDPHADAPEDFDPLWPLDGPPPDADIVAPCGLIRSVAPKHVVLVEAAG
jgi:hypothetical protein